MNKAQSILEYLVVLTIVILAITGGSFVFNSGVASGLNQAEQHIQEVLPTSLDNSYQGASVGYNPQTQSLAAILPSDIGDTHKGAVINYDPEDLGITILDPQSYEGRRFFEDKELGGYYYHEGQSDMSNVPKAETVVGQNVVQPESVTPFAW